MSEKANFKVDPRLAKLLGESYRSTESALKELVDNAWDAEATAISITLPEPMTLDPILVEDNGNGMTEQELRREYLTIANDRHSRKGDRTPRLKRLVKGRKGIGKFSGLMVASVMDVRTVARKKKIQIIISKESLLSEAKDLERIDLPITVTETSGDISGTTVILSGLNQRYEFPRVDKLKSLLMLEYGREHDVAITVNGEKLGVEDLPGEHFTHEDNLIEAGSIRLNFKISNGSKPLKQAGIAIRVSGKIVGKPGFFGLEDDPEIPPKLLKKVYGELEADGLEDGDSITADWGDVIENSKAFQALKPVVQAHIKNAVEQVFKREVDLQRGRLQQQINRRLAKMPEHRRRFAQFALEKVMKRFFGESDEKVEVLVSVVLDAFEKDDYWLILKQIDDSRDSDIETFVSALEDFGLLDMALMANQAQSRLKLLDSLEALIRNQDTLEMTIHKVIEANLWVLGYEYSLIASNKTTARTIEE